MRLNSIHELLDFVKRQGKDLKSFADVNAEIQCREADRVSALLSSRFGSGFENVACTQDASFFGALRIPGLFLRNANCKWIAIRLSNNSPLASIYGEHCILPEHLEQLKTELEVIGYIVVNEGIFLFSSSKNKNKCWSDNMCDGTEMNRDDLWYELFDHW